MSIKPKRSTTRKGQFQPGNPGGPGRPRREKIISLQISEFDPPPAPDADADPIDVLEHGTNQTLYQAFGYWTHHVDLTQSQFDRLMKVFKAMKFANGEATISQAYAKLKPQFVAEAFADLEAAIKRGNKYL